MSGSSPGRSFGQKRPPLSVTIKGILEKYPDGQIFKELIQNADDAKATVVKLVLDHRNLPTLPEHLVGTKYQGPALLAYNDAAFSEEDWEGIQNLQQSGKAKDPFKVGKFGIGFNSVYHITDLPVIISDSQCGYLDPHEKIWKGESGRIFQMHELHKMPYYLTPFERVCGFCSSPEFKGQTWFRFPLRNTPSSISQKCYNIENIQPLLAVLKDEAKHLLLFLRSVQSISVEEILEDNQTRKLFSVSVNRADSSNKLIQQINFIEQVEQTFKGESPYDISQVVIDKNSFSVAVSDDKGTSEHHWLVVHQVGSTNPKVREQAAQQHVLPWVGTALEVGSSTSSSCGRLFCSLPMPIKATAPLPVHVNGTFALNDNRRSLKWPAAEMSNDASAQWNKLLVEQCIPSCYVELLLFLIEQKHTSPNEVYKFWPQIEIVTDSEWSGILGSFFNYLFKHPVVYTEANIGEWVNVDEALFVPKAGISLGVECFLVSCCSKLTKVTSVVWRAFENQSKSVTVVTPTFLRKVMRNNPHESLNGSDKLELLKYCLSDEHYSDLNGLSLLPLANGEFAKFSTSNNCTLSSIYVCSSDYPCSLIPNALHKLVNPNDESLKTQLMDVAQSGYTQLNMLGSQEVAQLLRQYIPTGGYSSSWFATFWSWVRSHQLGQFDGLEVVPVGINQVGRLTKTDGVLIVSRCTDVSAWLASALAKYNVKLAQVQQNGYYLEHLQLKQYLHQFSVPGLLDAISSVCNCIQSVKLTSDEALGLQQFLATDSSAIPHKIQIVCQLSIFSTSQYPNGPYYSINEVKSSSTSGVIIAESHDYAITVEYMPSAPLVLSLARNQKQLLEKSAATFLSKAEFLYQVIFPMINSKSYPQVKVDRFMMEVLLEFNSLAYTNWKKNNQFIEAVKTLSFLKNSSGDLKSPQDLFDPSSLDLLTLLKGEAVFPEPPFNESKILQALKECGLRQLTSVTAQEILDIIYAIKMPASLQPVPSDNTKYERATAVVKFLNSNPHLCNSYVSIEQNSYTLRDALVSLTDDSSWLPVSSSRPVNYPSCLPWKGSLNKLASSKTQLVSLSCDINCSNLPAVVGSQAVFVAGSLPVQLAQSLSSSDTALASAVVDHLQTVINYKDQLTVSQLEDLVIHIYEYLNKVIQIHGTASVPLNKLKAWVWAGKANFIEPSSAALQLNPEFMQSLQPFVHVLPDKVNQYSFLTKFFNIQQYVSSEQIISVLDKDLQIVSHSQAWSIVIAIITWLVDMTNKDKSILQNHHILLPVNDNSLYPKMCSSNKLVYIDSEFIKIVALSSEESYTLVHPKVNEEMARALGVVPLSQHLDISEDIMEDAGQHEPLTLRLKNILRDYKNEDCLTIIKELLQNADDAGATELNILFDARQHSTSNLFFPGMSEAHGPALVVHNNATFTNEDFENITKLAGATKENKPLKIGKFGIGFCSVYHITDVPSFVSRDYLYIFDPTLKHLKGAVQNELRPGKKVKFTSTHYLANSHQLKPYEGLFGFETSLAFNGTMFRLPFRKSASKISCTVYNEDTIDKLTKNLSYVGSNLLLFTNNIKQITFSTILDTEHVLKQQLVISSTDEQLSENSCLKCFTISSSKQQKNEKWVVATCKKTFHNPNSASQHSIASVACQLKANVSTAVLSVHPVDGEVFCFLPLSVDTGLPVHISANFAVRSDRTDIWTSDSPSITNEKEVKWNLQLMNFTIPKAYQELLVVLKEHLPLHHNDWFTLWPLESKLWHKKPWTQAVSELYSHFLSASLLYSKSKGEWVTLQQAKFLQQHILSLTVEDDGHFIPKCVIDIMDCLKEPLVQLPREYMNQLSQFSTLMEHTTIIGHQEFASMFFSNIHRFNKIYEVRNQVLFRMLHDIYPSQNLALKQILLNNPCIPCCPDGKRLSLCNELLDPSGKLKALFEKKLGKFPVDWFCEKPVVKYAMETIGLITKNVPWNMLISSARGIIDNHKHDNQAAMNQVKQIISCIQENLDKDQGSLTLNDPEAKTLSSIPFLPVLSKPKNYPLPWKGEANTFLSANELVYYDNELVIPHLVGSQMPIVNSQSSCGGCGKIPASVKKLIKLRSPKLDIVLSHFQLMIRTWDCLPHDINNTKMSDAYEVMCASVYNFFDKKLKDSKTKSSALLSEYSMHPFIWTGKKFVKPSQVACEWSINGPYLFCVPTILANKTALKQFLKIKSKFTAFDLLDTLAVMNEAHYGRELPPDCQGIIHAIINNLCNIIYGDFNAASDINRNPVYLPDENYILRRADNLCYNDAPWCNTDSNCVFVNKRLPRSTALILGVKPVRSHFLQTYTSDHEFAGVPFGQQEKLTLRINNILRDYPCDQTLLKELIQNADDSGATKLCIILDERSHGREKVLSEQWSELQGPALLVWNDAVFSEEDLKGIQQLGLGSKREDSESIGQFGIGFNVVYHITDCPSFITGGDTLCVLDPHCRYAPGATPQAPGRRFDNLDSKFWENFSDLQNPYMKEGLPENLSHLKHGTLFRFPLRHTQKLTSQSEFVPKSPKKTIHPLEAQQMLKKLLKWIAEIRHSLLFLNHLCSIELIVIKNSLIGVEVVKEDLLELSLETADKERRKMFATRVRDFNRTNKPEIQAFPVTLKHMSQDEEHLEKWIVQQGVGDLSDPGGSWGLSDNVPKHGIAVPLRSNFSTTFIGNAFCFLPLDCALNLPVHVNGQFILNNNRRSIWFSNHSNDINKAWNDKLIQAIASSYAMLLVTIQCYFDSKSLQSYYRMFPRWIHSKCRIVPPIPEGEWKILAESVFRQLWRNNVPVLAPLLREESALPLQWYVLKDTEDGFQQAYFKPPLVNDEDLQLLTTLGITLTSAPDWVRKQFDELEDSQLVQANGKLVLKFYKNYHTRILSYPCEICETPFKTVPNFYKFTSYVLTKKPNSDRKEYYSCPFGFPLLLTADCQLREFKTDAVYASKFYYLFPKSYSQFLHPELLDCCLADDMFVSITKFDELFEVNYSNLKSNEQIDNTNQQNISLAQLKDLWSFLDSRSPHCQNKVALSYNILQATNGFLYSFSHICCPIVPPSESGRNEGIAFTTCCGVFEVLKKIRLPILDMSVHPLCCQYSLKLSTQPHKVLSALYAHHSSTGILDQISNPDDTIAILFNYFMNIHFKIHPKSSHQIKSLPLYKTITGSYTSINDKVVYICKEEFCRDGFEKWADSFKVVFLQKDGAWKILFSEISALEGEQIIPQELYTKLIFECFNNLSARERMNHLQFIRDNVIDKAKYEKQTNESTSLFLDMLVALPCLDDGCGNLCCVSKFTDPSLELHKMFPGLAKFPSEDYCDPKWIKFFTEIGLKKVVEYNDFLTMCSTVANGKHESIEKASNALLEYLFSEGAKAWGNDPRKLSEIAGICFVKPSSVDHLSWIKAPCCPVNSDLGLTTLRGAAVSSCANCVWTVMPIVNIKITDSDPLYARLQECFGMVVYPNSESVYQNIVNISSSQFGNFQLFHKYDLESQHYDNILNEVVIENLMHFHLHNEYEMLQKINCERLQIIPVNAESGTSSSSAITKPVLVNSLQVVHSPKDSIHHFIPYINELSSVLMLSLFSVLPKLGVTNDIQPKHLQYMLEKIHTEAENRRLDINRLSKVRYAVLNLSKCDDKSDLQKPLYLPNHNGKLIDSGNLLFEDTSRYRNVKQLNFQSTKFSLFSLPETNEVDDSFKVHEFCFSLPESVQPLPLSLFIIEQITRGTMTVSDQTILLQRLLRTKEQHAQFADVLYMIINDWCILPHTQNNCKEFATAVSKILQYAKVHVVLTLKADLFLTLTEPPTLLGNRLVPFILIKENYELYSLYIDHEAPKEGFWDQLARCFCIQAACNCNKKPEAFLPFQKSVCECLETKNLSKLAEEKGSTISTSAVCTNADMKPEIGKDIDETTIWQLDRDINNIFHPEEWVGYEIEDEHFVFAVVLHLYEEEVTNPVLRKYKIIASVNQPDGIVVGALDLFKFVMLPDEEENITMELVPIEAEGTEIDYGTSRVDINYLKRNIFKDLNNVQQLLTEDERRKGIKRLYLKYHPDKAGRNLAEKRLYEDAFKYLLMQLKRLKNKQSLLDPEEETVEEQSSYYDDEPDYHSWNAGVQKDANHWKKRSTNRKRRRTGERKGDSVPDYTSYQPQINLIEAKRWLQQAIADYNAMKVLKLSSDRDQQLCCHVCFMGHQVVEKSVKAGMYALCGLNDHYLINHALVVHARAISTLKPQLEPILSQVTEDFENHYTFTRYPNKHPLPQAPIHEYSYNEAQSISRVANEALQAIKTVSPF